MSEALNIDSIVREGVRKAQISADTTPALLVEDAEGWLEQDIPRRPWVATGLLLRGAVTVVVGAPASGKSSLMVGWATALALGKPYGRMDVQPVKVMTYNTEDDRDEQRRRFSGALRFFGARPADLAGCVMRLGTDTIGTLLAYDRETKELRATPAMDQMLKMIETMQPDVLMLDPLVELHEAEENDNTAVRTVMAYFRSLAIQHNLALVLLHHTRKGSAATAGDPDIARGASAVIGAARIVLTVTVMSEDEANTFGIKADQRRYFSRVDGAKINAAPIGREEWFERQSYELANGDHVAVMLPWAPPEDTISQDTMAAIQVGVERGSPAGPWSPRFSADARSIKRLLVEHGIVTADGQRKVMDGLMAAGFITATFRRSNRGTGKGLRSTDGLPDSVTWLEDDEA
ncbi:hypothetical protein AA13595_0893 [Gluconacetobacter johannae DSM 13595]|uniref:AAA family ATPase n=1 Tax=Gluconacetobacter johannae TaxID=112140 RepID=A0A7W4J983_9PROT|nr:AAA family ATPase [Gluconacetobacter johannae]MBB2177018.1 AAA family ATPase [Gluconacetobacter johannae]GBQ82322.1 hypothetical protein AA13595_0893 [Gluconacetobacter johannae DSM 13595]